MQFNLKCPQCGADRWYNTLAAHARAIRRQSKCKVCAAKELPERKNVAEPCEAISDEQLSRLLEAMFPSRN